MNPCHPVVSAIAGARFAASVRNFLFAIILPGLLLAPGAARAELADDDYLAIYTVIDQANTLNASGKTVQAHAKYVEAWKALSQFQRDNASWNPKVVSFRLSDLAQKITATAAPATASPAAGGTSPEAAPEAKPLVKLLDAGSEPRAVLRLHPAAGDKQAVTMTMKMGMDMSAAGQTMPATAIPGMVMNLDVAVKNVAADGAIIYTMAFNDATIAADSNTPPAVVTAMQNALAGISGMTGTGEMTDRGVVKNVEMKLPATAAAAALSQSIGQMKDSLSSSATPLPEEAVGAGARWEYKTRLKSQGMTLDQTMDFELVSMDGDHVTLRTTLTQSAASQKIQSAAAAAAKMELTRLTGHGSGTTVLDLGKVMPASATLDENIETVMGMTIGQQKQTMDMKMSMSIAIESK